MKSTGGYGKLILIVVATGFGLVAENKQNNCSVDVHCLQQKENTSKRTNTNGDLEQDSNYGMIRLKHVKQGTKEEKGLRKDNIFSDALKNLMVMVDKAKSGAVLFPSRKPVASPVSGTTITTPPPDSMGASTGATSTVSSESVPTSSAVGTSIPTSTPPSPTKTTTPPIPTQTGTPPIANQSTNTPPTPTPSVSKPTSGAASKPLGKPGGQPGKNYTVAPGIVITPNGQIVLNPKFPLLAGAGQALGGTSYPGVFPFPVSVLPGGAASSGIGAAPGNAPQPGAVGAASGQQVTPSKIFICPTVAFIYTE